MSETANIAEMAYDLSRGIFKVFGWQQVGPVDQKWKCETRAHGKSVHPTDVAFHYRDPYYDITHVVNCDLKSYAKDSLKRSELGATLRSLSMAVACSEFSEQWRGLYAPARGKHVVHGMLFVYNHDGGYDKDFIRTVRLVDDANFSSLNTRQRLFLISPADVLWLKNVSDDILRLRGEEKLPQAGNSFTFYYPDQFHRKKDNSWGHPATLEMITSPWIILRYLRPSSGKYGLIMYSKRKGADIDEFLYMFDYLTRFQLLDTTDELMIRQVQPNDQAQKHFRDAQQLYASHFNNPFGDVQTSTRLRDRLQRIEYRSLTVVAPSYSQIQIGMQVRT